MKHLIETTNPSGLAKVYYDRLILNSTTNDVIVGGGYEYVDLGLPSGLKWAKCNVGAEKETDFGDYFMWGSVTPNTADECNWATCPFNNKSSSYDSGYFDSVKDTVCPNGILAKEYDAATQIMGGAWRMPTEVELRELLDNTTQSWATINGVKGRKFTSRTDTSKYIFIPLAGICYDGDVWNEGYAVRVRTSSLYTPSPYYAWSFNTDHIDNSIYRCHGQSVRGVRN